MRRENPICERKRGQPKKKDDNKDKEKMSFMRKNETTHEREPRGNETKMSQENIGRERDYRKQERKKFVCLTKMNEN